MKIEYSNKDFDVIITEDAIGEDGNYGRMGYAIVNRETTIAETTTTILAQAIYTADHFSEMLKNVRDDAGRPKLTVVQAPDDDILPPH